MHQLRVAAAILQMSPVFQTKFSSRIGSPTQTHQAPRNDVNFKALNARKAIEASASAKAAKSNVESPTRTKNYGKVPAYLKERQAEMKAEEDRKCAMI